MRGIRKTRQITRAMKMVATVKLRHAQTTLINARPYAERMREITARLLAGQEEMPDDNPFFAKREIKKSLHVIVSTDRGLCGSLNTNLFRYVLNFPPPALRTPPERGPSKVPSSGGVVDSSAVALAKAEGRGGAEFDLKMPPNVEFLLVGRKARDFFKARQAAGGKYQIRDAMLFEAADASVLGRNICELYRSRSVDRIELFYTVSSSALRQQPQNLRLFPMDLSEMRKGGKVESLMFEPPVAGMLDDLVSAYAENVLRRIFMEAAVAEHAARMFTMDLATKNADDLISEMQLDMNKLRQLIITRELADITTGAEAIG